MPNDDICFSTVSIFFVDCTNFLFNHFIILIYITLHHLVRHTDNLVRLVCPSCPCLSSEHAYLFCLHLYFCRFGFGDYDWREFVSRLKGKDFDEVHEYVTSLHVWRKSILFI